jgi:outer membrane protein assembly factor BamB
MRKLTPRYVFWFAVVTAFIPFRQATASNWLTFGHDPQRTGWAKGDNELSLENVRSLQLKWKVHLKNKPLSLTALTAPLVASHVTTTRGLRTVVYVAGSSDKVFALDAQTGRTIWSKSLENRAVGPGYPGMWLCPNNLNATPTVDKAKGLIYALSAEGILYGLDLGTGKRRFGPVQFVPPFSKDWSLNLWQGVVYTAISQGCGGALSGIYAMDVHDPRLHMIRDLILEHGFGAGIWGRGGVVIGKNGRMYAATGDGAFNPANGDYGSSIIAVSPHSLKVLDYYSPKNHAELTQYDLDIAAASPVWFHYRDFNLLAGGGKEGVLFLLNADQLGGGNRETALDDQKVANDKLQYEENGIWGALSTWTEADGEVWVYVPVWGPASKKAPVFPLNHGTHSHGCIMAFRADIDARSGEPQLKPAWVSRDFDVPEPIALAGGVAFVLSTGENTQQTLGATVVSEPGHYGNRILNNRERMENTQHAILYALDCRTGRVLYQSGNIITTWVHFSGLSIANGQVYVVDHDSSVYCFGLKNAQP